VQALGREVDRLVGGSGLRRWQSLLSPLQRASERGLEGAVDPQGKIEVGTIRPLEDEDALEQYHVDVTEVIDLLAIGRRRLLRELRDQAMRAAAAEWQD
jgi:hypothetical protein